MKAITLHGLAPDNAGSYHDAGATLTVSDDPKDGCITAERAEVLVGLNSADEVVDKADKKDA
jgi:hypothetical protein